MFKAAADIQVGDILQLNRQVTVRVNDIRRVSDKQISFGGTYMSCDFEPQRIGATWTITKRANTKVETL